MYSPNCNNEKQGQSSVNVRTSRLARASFMSAIFSICALFVGALLHSILPFFICFGAAILAVTLGIIALVQIGLSAGSLAGRGPAVIGIALPTGFFLLIYGFVVLLPIRMVAYRMTCGSNLAGIGKAMLIYACDYEDKFPRAGGPESRWTGRILNWAADNRFDAYALALDGSGGTASISSSFYLLIKYGEISPESFVCNKDSGTVAFRLSEFGDRVAPGTELIDVWDFGPEPWKHCSYTYHLPYGPYALDISYRPGMAVAADRNPWIDSPAAKARDFRIFDPNGNIKAQKAGNTISHKGEGQNVLFVDTHVYFEKRPWCGVKDDNIYTYRDGPDRRRGSPPTMRSQPADRLDSLLVHDPPVAGQK
jgi:hypothetical protein